MEPVYRPVLAVARTLFRFEGLKFTVSGSENVPRT
ncbi:MAG: 1-acyl-sn-glycerol-3-phosphate acyltransferase, partial [Mycobacteriaceae bacterium]